MKTKNGHYDNPLEAKIGEDTDRLLKDISKQGKADRLLMFVVVASATVIIISVVLSIS